MGDLVQFPAADLALLQAQLNNATSSVAALQALNVAQSRNMDDFFLCTMGALVFLVSVVAYWIIGYCFAFGPVGNTIFGWGWITSGNMSDDQASMWFFQFTFAATSATIVSGALAERCRLVGYLIYTLIFSAFVYPWGSHWAWGGGWLMTGDGYIGYQDFAGSGVVHVIGGAAALAGAIILGPRTGRFVRVNGVEQPNPFGGHSVPLVTIGGIVLFFGFLAFNGGSQLHISQPGDGPAVAVAFMNTCIAGAFGLLAATLLKKLESKKWSLLTSINGGLAGMVSICAGANLSYQWGACCTGAIAGVVYFVASKIVARLHIDDPVDAIAVHLASGIWGVIAQPIFKRSGILTTWTRFAFKGLAWNLLGLVAMGLWSFVMCGIVFLALRFLGLLRLKRELEDGQDLRVHGEPAYPNDYNPHIKSAFDTQNQPNNNTNYPGSSDVVNLRDISRPKSRNGVAPAPVYGEQQYPTASNDIETEPHMQDDRYNM